MKKLMCILSLLMIASLVLASCGAQETEEPAATSVPDVKAPADEFRIGLVTDVGEVDDKSFNQSAWEGAQEGAAAAGGSVEYIETQDAKDYADNIGEFAEQG